GLHALEVILIEDLLDALDQAILAEMDHEGLGSERAAGIGELPRAIRIGELERRLSHRTAHVTVARHARLKTAATHAGTRAEKRCEDDREGLHGLHDRPWKTARRSPPRG